MGSVAIEARMRSWRCAVAKGLVSIALLAAGTLPHGREHAAAAQNAGEVGARAAIERSFLDLPLGFERNEGQAPAAVAYLSRGIGRALLLTASEAVLSLAGPGASWATFHWHFAGANPAPEIRGDELLAARTSYLIGSDPARWKTDVPNHARVVYRELYPGVDLVFRGSARQLEYDFRIAPGASPAPIRLRVEGSDSIRIDAAGDLHLAQGKLDLIHRAPRSYQEVDGRRIEVASRFVLRAGGEIGFAVGAYDRDRPLVIDPVLAYASYLGGSGADGVSGSPLGQHAGIAIDAAGSVVIAGETQSSDFPQVNAAQTSPGGGLDVFVTKLAPNGLGVIFSTYLGGNNDDAASAVACDAGGNVLVAGSTRSTAFPTRAAAQAVAGGGSDAFVAKLSPTGALLFATYLGGADDDEAAAIATEPGGFVHVAGSTRSIDFPLAQPVQAALGGERDAFVARLAPTGALTRSTYLGGAGDDHAEAIAFAAGTAFVAGGTSSPDFPTAAARQPTLSGVADGFVTRLAANGASLAYSTFLGGSGEDAVRGITAFASGAAAVIGDTSSLDFPTTAPLQAQAGGEGDAFVAALSPDGASLAFSTYLGGSREDTGAGIAQSGGSLFLTGTTGSLDFPVAAAIQPASGGESDAWLARLDPATGRLAFASYLGGEKSDVGVAIAAQAGRVALAGYTASRSFPIRNALKSELGLDTDAFVTTIDPATSALIYSTYLGGSSEESSSLLGQAIAVDAAGNAYLTGPTLSLDFPGAGSAPAPASGESDAYVAKVAADGASLVFTTYLGGRGEDAGLGIAVDPTGHAFVTGRTSSLDFPVLGALQPALAGGFDAFVTKLDASGAGLVYSTYLGGSGSDMARDVAIDASGAAVVAGVTASLDFPVHAALQPALAGGLDAFVAKLAPSGAALAWSTYLGGSRDEDPANTTWGVALDAAGNVVVSGTTESTDFPTALPIRASNGGSRDATVAKIAAAGAPLLFATYLGGSGGDTGRDVAVDARGRIYLVGATRSADFPIANALQPVHRDPASYDAFVARIGSGPSGPALDFSTFLGGTGNDGALGVAVDRAGNVHVTGQTSSLDFPVVGGLPAAADHANDAFAVVLPPAGDRIGYSTLLGGTRDEIGLGVAVDAAGSAYLTGVTASADFPTTAAFQPAFAGVSDAFVAKLALGPGALACDIGSQQASYTGGQVVTLDRLHFANTAELPVPARLRLDIDAPGVGRFQLFAIDLILPAHLDAELGPAALFPVGASQPRGAWSIGCALEDPVTGARVAEQQAAFAIE